jgi:hypothetical protein
MEWLVAAALAALVVALASVAWEIASRGSK